MRTHDDDTPTIWQLKDITPVQLEDMGCIVNDEFVDYSHLELLDEIAKAEFPNHAFMTGLPMKLGGRMMVHYLPPQFDLNLFQYTGLMATPDIAHFIEEAAPGQVELFPVAYKDDPQRFFCINLVKKFDCVDMERSGAEYNSEGRPFSIEKFVLRKAAIDPNVQIFTTAFLPGTVMMRNSLKEAIVNRHQIRGSVFNPVESV